MIIAVDFDGTIVDHEYPQIGRERPFAVATLKKLIEQGHILILWTVREGELLQEAVDWCAARGLRFYAVNANHPDETPESPDYSRKLQARLFIDDRNISGLPEWGVIYQMIEEGISYEDFLMSQHNGGGKTKKKKWGLF